MVPQAPQQWRKHEAAPPSQQQPPLASLPPGAEARHRVVDLAVLRRHVGHKLAAGVLLGDVGHDVREQALQRRACGACEGGWCMSGQQAWTRSWAAGGLGTRLGLHAFVQSDAIPAGSQSKPAEKK